MESKHKSQLDIHTQNTMKQMAALKMELQRAVELTKRKVIVLFTTLLVVYTLVYWPLVHWYPLLVLGASWLNGCTRVKFSPVIIFWHIYAMLCIPMIYPKAFC